MYLDELLKKKWGFFQIINLKIVHFPNVLFITCFDDKWRYKYLFKKIFSCAVFFTIHKVDVVCFQLQCPASVPFVVHLLSLLTVNSACRGDKV